MEDFLSVLTKLSASEEDAATAARQHAQYRNREGLMGTPAAPGQHQEDVSLEMVEYVWGFFP